MSTVITHEKRTRRLVATAVATAALAASVAFAAPAMAANGIEGEAFVTLDFTTAGQVAVDVDTKNLSEVTAHGSAIIEAPDGQRYLFGPREYEAGGTWTYSKVLVGYSCADLGNVSAIAIGGSTPELNDWNSGVVTYPDRRVTVIGCDVVVPPVDPPVEPPVVVPPVVTPPVVTPPVVTPTTPPVVTPTTPPVTKPAATPGKNVLPAAKTDGALLASTGSENGAVLGGALLAGALLIAGAGAVALRRR